MKGLDKVREKMPAFGGRKIIAIPLLMLFIASLSLGFMLFLDILPRILNTIQFLTFLEPILPIAGSLLVAIIGVLGVTSFWRNKDSMIAKHKELAYQKIFPRGASGVFILMSLILHLLFSVRSLPPGPPVNPITIEFSKSLLYVLSIPVEYDVVIRVVLGGILMLFGFLTMRRAIMTFGVDYMLVVYLYFPEEGEIQENDIYSVIRHPTYFSGVLLILGLMVLRLSVYSITISILILLALSVWIRVEEKELVERFGEGYAEYMSKTPGLHVRIRDFGKYIRFLKGSS
ncbi:MAG: methyltransferase [Candidatus Thorarchaeota archaeon]|nr:methyltransferase [Candidatus Thorarchaeota archaeon]